MTNRTWEPTAFPGHYFSRIARAMTRVGDARLKAIGVATAQLPILSVLQDGACFSQAELARWARVEQPSMAQMLARMERDGLIQRAPDPNDRRSSLVSLTPRAQARLPEGREILRKGNEDMTSGLSEAEIATLVGLLKRVLANLDALEAGADPAC